MTNPRSPLKSLTCLLLIQLAITPAAAETDSIPISVMTVVHLDSLFANIEGPGSFILLNEKTDKYLVHNPERIHQRFIPASTFKIPNTLIALETGVVDGPEFSIKRDSVRAPASPYWPRSWKRDQTLRTAFQNSVYWYYQEVARRIGKDRVQEYVDRFEYGNRNIAPKVDTFWLHGDLRISPIEQIRFIQQFCRGKLGVSQGSTDIVKEIMVLDRGDGYVLRGKTGTADVTPTRELGWLVGYLERGDDTYYYALNMEGERVWEESPPQTRKELVLEFLRVLKVLG